MKSKSKYVKLAENLGSSTMNGDTPGGSFHTKLGHVCESMSGMKENSAYQCGACSHQFETICRLHDHLQENHSSRGCYHYDSTLKTAFPKYDTVCCHTQTMSLQDHDKRSGKQGTGQLKKGQIANDETQSSNSNENSTSYVIEHWGQRKELSKKSKVFATPDSKSFGKKPAKNIQKPTRSKDKLKSVKTLKSAKKTKLSCTKIVEQNYHSRTITRNKNKDNLLEIQSSAVQLENTKANINYRLNPDILPDTQEQSQHIDSGHLGHPIHSCSFCEVIFTNQRDLDKHIYTEHASSEPDKTSNEIQEMLSDKINDEKTGEHDDKCIKRNVESKAPYTCEECGHVMPWNKKDVHERLHSGERPYICELCGKGLISKNKLKRHMLTHSDVKKHKCEVCGVGFQMKYKLRMHMHIHTGKKPYLCSICGAEFNHSSNLATHTRCVHRQIKPHECGICGGKYAKKSQLDDHMLSHSSEKQFTCRFCGKSFKYQKGMKRHEKTHEDDKSLRCEKCEAQFVHKADFLHHISVAHKEEPLRCSKCKKVFFTENDLKEHKATDCDKKKYQCSICGEYYKVCNQYFTHMLAAHGIEREQAKILHSQHKQKNTEQVSGTSVNQSLFSPIDVPNVNVSNQQVAKNSNSALNPSFNMQQMVTGLLDENKSTLSALTRVATENLRLHSQDIQEEEKINSMVMPPLTPSVMLCRNVDGNGFVRPNNVSATNPIHSVSNVVNVANLNTNLTGNMQPENNSYVPTTRDGLYRPDRNINRTNLLNMAGSLGVNQTSDFIGNVGDRNQALNTISMIPLSTSICAGQVALLEHESTLALRRLAENSGSQVMNQTILACSSSTIPTQETGNQQQPSTVGFSIQNLF